MSTMKRAFGALVLSLIAVTGFGMFGATSASAEVFQAPYSSTDNRDM